jgi:hypothetical protein
VCATSHTPGKQKISELALVNFHITFSPGLPVHSKKWVAGTRQRRRLNASLNVHPGLEKKNHVRVARSSV